jgi:hypothetical protein
MPLLYIGALLAGKIQELPKTTAPGEKAARHKKSLEENKSPAKSARLAKAISR